MSFEIVGLSRPKPGELANGDLWFVDYYEGSCRICLIDGLGHGKVACETARLAGDALRARPDLNPARSIELIHRTLAGTRGAAATVVTIAGNLSRLSYAGAGNVEGRILNDGKDSRLIIQRGTLGYTISRTSIFEAELGPAWLMLLHSDGISARFDLQSFADRTPTLTDLAASIMDAVSRPSDDATLVLARGSAGDEPG